MVPKPVIDAKAPPSGPYNPEHIITPVADATAISQEPALHHHDQDTDTSDALTASNPSMRRKPTASLISNPDADSWVHLSVDQTGATLRTVCLHDHENREACTHPATERRYRDFPRVNAPAKKITVQGVKNVEHRDRGGVVERDGLAEDGEEEWVVLKGA